MKTYPTIVSRTLDPSGKSLATVVGLHDHEITDADINLVQDLQDYKRQQLLKDQTTSGCLTYTPMVFNPFIENTFFVPSFDILFNGEVLTITGSKSSDQTLNRVVLPPPAFWTLGVTDEDARLYVVFLEIWYQSLDPISGSGYFVDPTDNNLRFFYPYGCVTPDPILADSMPDDSIDIFNNGLYTTQRAQIQWRLNIQRVALTYDFSKFQFGLDPGARPTEIVYGQASQSTPIVDPIYQFTNMGSITGDSGLWRAGDGNVSNSLGTMDGYSYAMPIGVVFQRNVGPFSLNTNIFGCADPTNQNSGLLINRFSGRFDSKLADQVFVDDVVDTRQTINLDGWNFDKLMKEGFVDVISGNIRLAVSRGESPGQKPEALGSTQNYFVSMAPTVVTNTNTVGSWDGFSNGFSSDKRVFKVTKQVTINQKSVGTNGVKWSLNDAFTLTLPVQSIANISSIDVQGLVNQGGVKIPVSLLEGQIQISGLGSKSVTVTFTKPLTGTLFDPGANNLYATIGVEYPANSGVDLKKTPFAVEGGLLFDAVVGKTLPVYGVSEYQVQVGQPALQAFQVWAINPEYSNVLFGTKIWIQVPGSQGVQQTTGGSTFTTFILDRTGAGAGLNNKVNGLYVTRCWDFATGDAYTVSSRIMKGNQCFITVQGLVSTTSTVVFSFLAQDTAQLVYNAPVKGVTEIEETVLFGNYTTDQAFPMDNRVVIESVTYDSVAKISTIILGAKNCTIKGISGDDVNKFIWLKDQIGNLTATTISTANFNNGMVTITVAGDVTAAPLFFVGSILPAFDPNSQLTISERYVPYQGEGTLHRNYEILHADENALITTNGSGKAPVVGLADVYPYNRELPISIMLPAQVAWSDASLTNTALATFFDSNYEAMRVNNVEHTFEAPLHTNDFIPPMNKDIRKDVQFITATGNGRGFAQAIPHIGFAIRPPVARTVLGQNLQATTAPIAIFVNNLNGKDNNDGLSLQTPKLTITAALNSLPPVLRHPCSIQLIDTGTAYSISQLKDSLQVVALGDGDIRATKYYALGNLAFSIQESGRLVITRTAGATGQISIDATGFTGFGDGPTSAFFVDSSRVIFNGLRFIGFRDPAVKGIDSDIEFVNCDWLNNIQSGSFEQSCGVIIDKGSITLPDGGSGFVLSQSQISSSDTTFIVAGGATPGAFFAGERQSTVNLQSHGTSTLEETNITSTVVIAQAELNSSIVTTSDFQSNGKAVLTANSTLARTVKVNPFLGGVDADPSSTVVTQL